MNARLIDSIQERIRMREEVRVLTFFLCALAQSHVGTSLVHVEV